MADQDSLCEATLSLGNETITESFHAIGRLHLANQVQILIIRVAPRSQSVERLLVHRARHLVSLDLHILVNSCSFCGLDCRQRRLIANQRCSSLATALITTIIFLCDHE